MQMKGRERVARVMAGERPSDRLPKIEWATWWNLTLDRWRGEGLPDGLDGAGLMDHFGLDRHFQHWFWGFDDKVKPKQAEPVIYIEDEADYERLRPHLYNVWTSGAWPAWQQDEDAAIWFTLNGFFWWPRVLFGVEGHLYAIYDHPDLMQRINQDMADYALRCIDAICRECQPQFMTFAEDMSYNHGPMLSKDAFDEFLAPWYRKVAPELRRRGIRVLVDSDGGVEPLIPWLKECGIEGILPLERMAGVDVIRVRADHPDFILVGGFDKLVMSQGEAAMRQEFERILPSMNAGRFIPSVDHQTPPEVSLENYAVYLSLLDEYTIKGAQP